MNMPHTHNRMVRQLSTLPARKEMDQLLNYYSKWSAQMSLSVKRYDNVYTKNSYALHIFSQTVPVYVYAHTCHCMALLNVSVSWALADIVNPTQNGLTPLMTASLNGHIDIVKMLIKAMADVDAQKKVCCFHHHEENTLHNVLFSASYEYTLHNVLFSASYKVLWH